jgi:hypothetical protein
MPTTLFPIVTASDYVPGTPFANSTNKMLSLTRGAGVQSQVDNTIAGLSSEIVTSGNTVQCVGGTTSMSAGTSSPTAGNIVWISKALAAVTISGTITVNHRSAESAAQANYGASATVWALISGSANLLGVGGSVTELATAEAATNFNITPTSRTLSDGDRVVVVFHYGAAGGSSASGRTASFFYAGASGATGDSFVTFTETITEQGGAATVIPDVYTARPTADRRV